jgi:hypothetical protein
MAGISFAVPLALGAAALALWVDCRLGTRRPQSPRRRFAHAAVAFALLQISSGVAGGIVTADAPAEQRFLVAFFLLLPSLVYAFVAGFWLVRTLAEATRTTGS